jgi:hypothetical protein
MTKGAAVVDLPPAPPAYVEEFREAISSDRCQVSAALGGCPPEEPPHGHPHQPHGETGPRRVYLSDSLSLGESLTPQLLSRQEPTPEAGV